MKVTIRNMVVSAMFFAIGMILPFITGQIQQIGNMLLPMHIPVLLCGMICGWQYGAIIGFLLPFVRFATFGMPPIYPIGMAMAFELAAYGIIAGILYRKVKTKGFGSIYISLISAMIGGRMVWGLARIVLSTYGKGSFTYQMFVAGAFVNAIPGIIIQLVLIPAIMFAVKKEMYSKK